MSVDPRFKPMLDSLSGMVSVAKRLRRQVVALEIEGSNPFAHPIFIITYMSLSTPELVGNLIEQTQ